MSNLWSLNTPARFWLPEPAIPDDEWSAAIHRALPVLGLPVRPADLDELTSLILGEGQFGPDHWRLSFPRRVYYEVKPLIPRSIISRLRRIHSGAASHNFALGWPIEDRYARFLWEVMRGVLLAGGRSALSYRHFWPNGCRFAFVLTHDIETTKGQAFVRTVADLEESLGFRSSFNFVAERYPLDMTLIDELRARGFEIGIHGLKHDGHLFRTRTEFEQRARRINDHMRSLGAVGFRTPLFHRQPEWMQVLDLEYDLSFFDTDPYEPLPGGTMCIWPFTAGRLLELPLTLVQDYTLVNTLGERTTRPWLQKIEFIEQYSGMALMNTHPDYLLDPATLQVYASLLHTMKERDGYWHALPREVAAWWRARSGTDHPAADPRLVWGALSLDESGQRLVLAHNTKHTSHSIADELRSESHTHCTERTSGA